MSNKLNLEDNIHTTNRKLENLKESWKDNVQEKFYNDKVDDLNLFFSRVFSNFESIDQELSGLKNKINNV